MRCAPHVNSWFRSFWERHSRDIARRDNVKYSIMNYYQYQAIVVQLLIPKSAFFVFRLLKSCFQPRKVNFLHQFQSQTFPFNAFTVDSLWGRASSLKKCASILSKRSLFRVLAQFWANSKMPVKQNLQNSSSTVLERCCHMECCAMSNVQMEHYPTSLAMPFQQQMVNQIQRQNFDNSTWMTQKH